MAVCDIEVIDAGTGLPEPVVTADGAQHGIASWVRTSDACCLPHECLDPCTMACSFVSLLPSGPLWDSHKRRAIEQIITQECSIDEPLLLDDRCSSIVAHAVYKAQNLTELVQSAIWPAFRESDPFTASTSLDQWLERLGWFDCYRTTCRSVSLGPLTALEVMGECGPVYCEIPFNDELQCAVKKGIVRSLARINTGIIDNLASINWVLEPLGALVRPYYPDGVEAATDCCDVQLELCNASDLLLACDDSIDACFGARPSYVQAWHQIPCEDLPMGMPEIIWPGIIAAECIVRSLLMKSCPNIVRVCCLSASEE